MADSIFLKKRKGRALWLCLPIILFFYFVLFPRPVGRELYLRTIWANSVSSASTVLSDSNAPRWSFRASDTFGYADLDGNLYYLGQRLHNLSVSDSGFINYGRVPDHIVFMNTRGEFQFSIKSYGYPLLGSGGEFLYSINTDLSGLKRIDREGQTLWSMAFPVPLTTVALAGEECVIGLMDGHLLLIGVDGEVLFEQDTEGSRIPVILGTAITEDRQQIALFSGIDPQILSIVHRRDNEFISAVALDLDSDFRREVALSFSPDARFLYFEVEDGLGVLDIRKKITAGILSPGVLRSVEIASDFSAAAFRTESGSNLLIFRPLSSVLLSQQLAVPDIFLRIIDNSLILGIDGNLLRADLTEG
jgi:hypothetical protein